MPAAKKNVPWHIQIPVITFEVAVMDLPSSCLVDELYIADLRGSDVTFVLGTL